MLCLVKHYKIVLTMRWDHAPICLVIKLVMLLPTNQTKMFSNEKVD